MTTLSVSFADLTLASLLVVALAVLSLRLRLAIHRQILIAGARTFLQLLLIGFVLKWLFAHASWRWITTIAVVMVAIAGVEVVHRQKHRFKGPWGYGIGTFAMLVSSFVIAHLALRYLIESTPWYAPRYFIPILGMLLGNTMNGIALGIDRLTDTALREKATIEGQLLEGFTADQAIAAIRKDSLRTGLIPIINAMAIAGLVSLPGMMTGQILAGALPIEAVKYQILIMFLIAGGTGFGTLIAVSLGARRLFDERDRLRLDRLRQRS